MPNPGIFTRETLIAWLIENGHSEEKRGYGHRTAEDLADALIEDDWVALDE